MAEPPSQQPQPQPSPPQSLASWLQSSPTPLLLDLRSVSAHRARRISPSACIPWRRLEEAWFTLPAYGVPFAVLLPDESSEQQAQAEERRQREASGTAQQPATSSAASQQLPPPQAEDEEADSIAPSATSATISVAAAVAGSAGSSALGVKARTKAGPPPLPPSSSGFVYSVAAVVGLLRYYGWVVPEGWVWLESAEFWAGACAAGLTIQDASTHPAQQMLFRPAQLLSDHFESIQSQLRQQRQLEQQCNTSSAAAVESDTAPTSPASKRARHSTTVPPDSTSSVDAATAASSSSVAVAAAAAAGAAPAPFMCLDVACGSGRDLAWILGQQQSAVSLSAPSVTAASSSSSTSLPSSSASSSPAGAGAGVGGGGGGGGGGSDGWVVCGLDSSSGALSRAQRLCAQLGVEDRARLHRARLNQSNGQWTFSSSGSSSGGKTEPDQNAATPASTQPAAQSTLVDSSTASASVTAAATAAVAAPTRPTITSMSAAQQERREKRKKKEALRALAAAASTSAGALCSPCSSPSAASSALAAGQYELVLMVRFLSRVFIREQLGALLKAGGFFVLSTFIDEAGVTPPYAQPANALFRVAGRAELRALAAQAGLHIVRNTIGTCEDGRPVCECIMRKPLVGQVAATEQDDKAA